jgi:arginase
MEANQHIDSTQIKYKYIKDKTVGIIGVSVKEGQDLEGPEKAPQYLRDCGLFDVIKSLDWVAQDYGDITEHNIVLEKKEDLIKEKGSDYLYTDLKNALELGAVCKKLYMNTKKMAEAGQFALTLGGDHGLATGSISGLKAAYPDLKIIWVDAHGDCNVPETSPSGNYHGMPVAHLLGWMGDKTVPGFDWLSPCITNEDIVFIGLRDLDKEEKKLMRKNNIKCYTMHDILKIGIGGVLEQTLKYLTKDGDHPIHISFDIDAIDPSVAYGTGTKSRGGLLYREAHYIVREAVSTGLVVGLDIVEINPLLDTPKEHYHGDNKYIKGTETVSLGLELIASVLGDSQL